MNLKNRFLIAAVLTLALVLVSAGVWAAPKFQGTVPAVLQTFLIPVTGCLEEANMGTAIFSVQPATGCITGSDLVSTPAGTYVAAPEGKTFTGDTFKLTVEPADTLLQVCYAYTPELAAKEAKIFRLNEDAAPNVWVEVPGAVVGDGTICVSSIAGVFGLIGNP